MTYTHAQLRDRVAEDLGIKAVDEELSDESAAKIEERITSTTAYFREKGLIWWADDAIPVAAFEGMAFVMRARCCAGVRKAGQGHEEMEQPGLSMIAAVKPPGQIETMRTLYY